MKENKAYSWLMKLFWVGVCVGGLLVVSYFFPMKKREFYGDGTIKIEKQLRMLGIWTDIDVYLPDQTLIGEYRYFRGKRHGVNKIYRNDGSLFQKEIYRNGTLIATEKGEASF